MAWGRCAGQTPPREACGSTGGGICRCRGGPAGLLDRLVRSGRAHADRVHQHEYADQYADQYADHVGTGRRPRPRRRRRGHASGCGRLPPTWQERFVIGYGPGKAAARHLARGRLGLARHRARVRCPRPGRHVVVPRPGQEPDRPLRRLGRLPRQVRIDSGPARRRAVLPVGAPPRARRRHAGGRPPGLRPTRGCSASRTGRARRHRGRRLLAPMYDDGTLLYGFVGGKYAVVDPRRLAPAHVVVPDAIGDAVPRWTSGASSGSSCPTQACRRPCRSDPRPAPEPTSASRCVPVPTTPSSCSCTAPQRTTSRRSSSARP